MDDDERIEFLAKKAGIEVLKLESGNWVQVDSGNEWTPSNHFDQLVLTWKALDSDAIDDMVGWVEMSKYLRKDSLMDLFYEATIDQFTLKDQKKHHPRYKQPFPHKDATIWEFK